jgi:hypothetical protein
MAVEYGTKGPLTMSDTPKMNPEVKAKWVEALRSGDYHKGQFGLRYKTPEGHADGYCCLGVLCDLYNKETGQGEWGERVGNRYDFKTPDGSFNVNYAPDEVLKWAGLSGSVHIDIIDPTLGVDRQLASINDQSASFDPVISVIEKVL